MIKIGKNISEWSVYSCQPKTKKELKKIIEDRISKEGSNCDLNDIDVSLIDDMSWLFYNSKFNGDISKWDVSKVNNIEYMFFGSEFNGKIGNWNVNNVKNMNNMFTNSNFDQDISNWKINSRCWTGDIFYICRIRKEYKPKALQ